MARERRCITVTIAGRSAVWKRIFDVLAQECDEALIFIHASVVRAHRAASGSKWGSYKRLLAAPLEVAHTKFTLL